jgi:hypothetical protein
LATTSRVSGEASVNDGVRMLAALEEPPPK